MRPCDIADDNLYIIKPPTTCLVFYAEQKARLHINGIHASLGSDRLCKEKGVLPRPGAKIDDGRTRLNLEHHHIAPRMRKTIYVHIPKYTQHQTNTHILCGDRFTTFF